MGGLLFDIFWQFEDLYREGKKNLLAIITFIDFIIAFDTIHRDNMLKTLKAHDMPEQIVNAIRGMYNNNTREKVITPDEKTELVKILAGVIQGDTLAPYIFVVV